MTTRLTGQNIISTLNVLRTQMNFAANRWEIYYTISRSTAEPEVLIDRTQPRSVFIQNIPEQTDGEGNVISPAEPNLSLFQDLLTDYDSIVSASEAKAVEHAEETGVFTEYVDDTDDLLIEEGVNEGEVIEPWVADEQVAVGFKRSFQGVNYVCRQKHTTQADWTPDVTPALWLELPTQGGGGLDLWQSGTNYLEVGMEVEHNGENWRNRRANNTQQIAPGTAQSGWMQISNTPAEWYNLGNEGYPIGWTVTQGGNTYESTINNNFWNPNTGVGWVIVQ